MRIGRAVLVFICAAALMSGCIGAGVNSPLEPQGTNRFPKVTGINLNGQSVEIPSDLPGHPRIVVTAFEQAQQADVDTWLNALSPDLAAAPTLRIFELPVIYTGTAAFRFWVNNGMRSGVTAPDARERTITVYTEREAFFRELQVRQESISTFLLDRTGTIRWRADGPATEELLQSLRGAIAAASKQE